MEFRSIAISVILSLLFVYAMISFSVYLSGSTGKENKLFENDIISSSYTDIESDISQAKEDTEKQRGSFIESVPIIGDIISGAGAIAGFGKMIYNLVVNSFDMIFSLLGTTLGISPTVISVLSIILIITLILLIWAVWRVGR